MFGSNPPQERSGRWVELHDRAPARIGRPRYEHPLFTIHRSLPLSTIDWGSSNLVNGRETNFTNCPVEVLIFRERAGRVVFSVVAPAAQHKQVRSIGHHVRDLIEPVLWSIDHPDNGSRGGVQLYHLARRTDPRVATNRSSPSTAVTVVLSEPKPQPSTLTAPGETGMAAASTGAGNPKIRAINETTTAAAAPGLPWSRAREHFRRHAALRPDGTAFMSAEPG